jgi:hypothetical protein
MQNAVVDDTWSLNLDFVQSLREDTVDKRIAESLPQILAMNSYFRQFIRFKLSPTHDTPRERGDEAPSFFQASSCVHCL